MEISIVVWLVGLVVVESSLPEHPLHQEWFLYKKKYGKEFETKEDSVRFNKYLSRKKLIEQHNQAYRQGRVSYMLDINHFTDMPESELRQYTMNTTGFEMLEYDLNNVVNITGVEYLKKRKKLDWRSKGVVTPVKDQGECGSCWAFSTTGALEGQHALKKGKLVSLSEQNLVDCETDAYGCVAGWPADAFMFIKNNGGINTESSYPYKGKVGKCSFDPNAVGATDVGFSWVPRDEKSLLRAVTKIGPLSVCISTKGKFRHYKKGIFDGKCSNRPKSMHHCVLLVGYGKEHGKDYWLVKNSWGKNWGYVEQGLANILMVDWTSLARLPCYPWASLNTWEVGKCLGLAVSQLPTPSIHAVGFSLGAHLVSFASNFHYKYFNSTFDRITGLDPALPFFATTKNWLKLDKTDADFVDVIHTNCGMFGKLEPSGHADFYVNSATIQPMCRNHTNPPFCSHTMATTFFAESIRSDPRGGGIGFYGTRCPSYLHFALDRCNLTLSKSQFHLMGEYSDTR